MIKGEETEERDVDLSPLGLAKHNLQVGMNNLARGKWRQALARAEISKGFAMVAIAEKVEKVHLDLRGNLDLNLKEFLELLKE